jgi:hypothetical protein
MAPVAALVLQLGLPHDLAWLEHEGDLARRSVLAPFEIQRTNGSPLPPGYVPVGRPGDPGQQSVDQLINVLEAIRAQKAELEKQGQAVKGVLGGKLAEQNKRLKELGVDAPPTDLIPSSIEKPEKKR